MPAPGGHWKQTDNDIIERHPDGTVRVRFKPTPAHLTPIGMNELTTRYADALRRIARLLTLMLLYHFNYEVGRYVSIERVYEGSREGYYKTLEASSQGWHEGRDRSRVRWCVARHCATCVAADEERRPDCLDGQGSKREVAADSRVARAGMCRSC
ncbi:MAG TPA: hypothetical protein VJ011_08215 [Steroidobacteraceae bacterium]|nr:hypothetical protein [Steroidobacteraceae bacterium]